MAFQHQTSFFFDELNPLGAVHHTSCLLHVERAQQALFQKLLSVVDFDGERDEDICVVVTDLDCHLGPPVSNPGDCKIELGIIRVRSCAVALCFKFSHNADEPHRSGTRTVCKICPGTGDPRPWTEAFQEVLESMSGA